MPAYKSLDKAYQTLSEFYYDHIDTLPEKDKANLVSFFESFKLKGRYILSEEAFSGKMTKEEAIGKKVALPATRMTREDLILIVNDAISEMDKKLDTINSTYKLFADEKENCKKRFVDAVSTLEDYSMSLLKSANSPELLKRLTMGKDISSSYNSILSMLSPEVKGTPFFGSVIAKPMAGNKEAFEIDPSAIDHIFDIVYDEDTFSQFKELFESISKAVTLSKERNNMAKLLSILSSFKDDIPNIAAYNSNRGVLRHIADSNIKNYLNARKNELNYLKEDIEKSGFIRIFRRGKIRKINEELAIINKKLQEIENNSSVSMSRLELSLFQDIKNPLVIEIIKRNYELLGNTGKGQVSNDPWAFDKAGDPFAYAVHCCTNKEEVVSVLASELQSINETNYLIMLAFLSTKIKELNEQIAKKEKEISLLYDKLNEKGKTLLQKDSLSCLKIVNLFNRDNNSNVNQTLFYLYLLRALSDIQKMGISDVISIIDYQKHLDVDEIITSTYSKNWPSINIPSELKAYTLKHN